MSDLRIATRYAKSIFTLAEQKKKLTQIRDDMKIILSVCKENRDLRLLLKSPIIKFDKKKSILLIIFSNKINEITLKLLEMICNKNRSFVLLQIAEVYITLYNEIKNLQKATLKTTFSIDEILRKEFIRVVRGFTGKEVQLEEIVDKNLIGGYILMMNNMQIDTSLRTKLNRLRTKLIS